MGDNPGLARWIGASTALHALLFVFLLVDLPARKLPEPEQALTVELVTPAEVAKLANAPLPKPVAAPPAPDDDKTPTPKPPIDEPPKPNQPEAPPPPPPPPPPAAPAPPSPTPPVPQSTPTPPTPPRAAPTPPAPVQAPAPPPPPAPTPPRPTQQPPQQVDEAAMPAPPPPPPPPTPSPQRPAPQPAAPSPTPTPPRPQQPANQPAPAADPGLPSPPPPPPAPPTQPPTQTAGTGQTPPTKNPNERSTSVLNTLEKLRAAQQQTQAPTARPNSNSRPSASGGGAPTGNATLTQGEIRGVADKISECWNVDGGMMGLSEIVVELKLDIDPTGIVRNVRPSGSIPSDPRARSVYESARRAVLAPQCQPLPVPRDKIPALNASTFRFSPRGLVR